MFGALGRAPGATCFSFVSKASLESGELSPRLSRTLLPVENCRSIGKKDLLLNDATPKVEVDPDSYQVRVDGTLIQAHPRRSCPWRSAISCFEGSMSHLVRIETVPEGFAPPPGLFRAIRVPMTAEDRSRVRRRFIAPDGRELALALPTGTRLWPGQIIHSDKDRVYVVEAAPEPSPSSGRATCARPRRLGIWSATCTATSTWKARVSPCCTTKSWKSVCGAPDWSSSE